jgi:hypothetical protein
MRSWLLMTLMAVGCSAERLDIEDGVADSLPGKADGGIAEGSADACRVLTVANEVSLDVLDDDVGLSRRAASNIVAGREYSTLAELDAVPYVGPLAFEKLLEFATEYDYGSTCVDEPPAPGDDPFSPNRCAGTALTNAQALALIDLPYETQRDLAIAHWSQEVRLRERRCYAASNTCTAWREHYEPWAFGGNDLWWRGLDSYMRTVQPDLHLSVFLQNDKPTIRMRAELESDMAGYDPIILTNAIDTPYMPNGMQIETEWLFFDRQAHSPIDLATKMTSDCIEMHDHASWSEVIDTNNVTIERDVSVVVHY